MQNNPVVWFEIYVQDMQRAKGFYENVFAVQLEKIESPDPEKPDCETLRLEMWAFPMRDDAAGANGALVRMPGFPSGGNSTVVYFSSTDCAVEAQRAKDNGGQIIKEKMAIGQYGFIALITDTEGNMIGIHSM